MISHAETDLNPTQDALTLSFYETLFVYSTHTTLCHMDSFDVCLWRRPRMFALYETLCGPDDEVSSPGPGYERRDSPPASSALAERQIIERRPLFSSLSRAFLADVCSLSRFTTTMGTGRDSSVGKSTMPFSAWVLKHRSLILPLLGQTTIAERLLNAKGLDATFKYEPLHEQPKGVRATLMPHQMDGIAFLQNLRSNNAHGILADEMGLGKTLQTLSFFKFIMNSEKGDDRPFLVVCPLSVLGSWMAEIKTKTNMRAAQFRGECDIRQFIGRLVRPREVDVVITTYETLVNDTNRLQRISRWKCVVLDEGHRLKSSTKRLAIAVKKLKTDQRIVLTGTPIQNDLKELWSILNWLYPEVFVQETSSCFENAFSLTEGKVDTLFLQQVNEFLQIIMLRRTKELTAGVNLHPKKEVNIYLPLTDIQRALYLEVLTGVAENIGKSGGVLQTPPASPQGDNFSSSSFDGLQAFESDPGRSILNILMELRKICVHPLLVANVDTTEEQINISTLINSSSKFILLRRLLEEEVIINNKKVLFFSGFDYALSCCQSVLDYLHIRYVRLDGRTSCALWKYNVHRFSQHPQCKDFIMATRAGGEGITLTAAEVVVFLDLDFNPQVTNQAEARAHRLGQTKCVTVYKMCTRGTVEMQMLHRVNKKICLASRLLDTNIARLSMASENVESESTFIENILRPKFQANSMEGYKPEKLLSMDWAKILELCTEIEDPDVLLSPPQSPPLTPGSDWGEEQKLWLSCSAKINTGLFNGNRFRRPTATLKEDVTNMDLKREERRFNKERSSTMKQSAITLTRSRPYARNGKLCRRLLLQQLFPLRSRLRR